MTGSILDLNKVIKKKKGYLKFFFYISLARYAMCCCFDHLVFPVDVGELPLVAGDAHPLVFSCQVDELPPFLPLLVVLFGVVGEGVQLLV